MREVTFDELKNLPDGTLFTYDSADEFVRRAVFVKGEDQIKTSHIFKVYDADELAKLADKVERARGLLPHKAEYEP